MHLSIAAIFTYCVQIVESGLVSAGVPSSWVDVEIKCRLTRQRVVMMAPKTYRQVNGRFIDCLCN